MASISPWTEESALLLGSRIIDLSVLSKSLDTLMHYYQSMAHLQ